MIDVFKKVRYLVYLITILLCGFGFHTVNAMDIDFKLFNRALAYNGENTQWNDTIITQTYFENFTEATVGFNFNDLITLRVGGAVFVPFSLELPDGIRFFPFVQTQISNEYVSLTMGNLDSDHNLPSVIFDPLIKLTPYVRASEENLRIPNGTETYQYGKFTHGYYEYGMSFKWFKGGSGELYMNWQLLHTEEHRERFDVGLMYALDFVSDIFTPYVGVHYWHNGGHEYPFVEGTPAITENYVGGIGINSDKLSILYLASYNILDRDYDLSGNKFGQALFVRGLISVMGWFELEPVVFVSSYYIDSDQRFVSIEGDPFFRVPFYAGLNIYRTWEFAHGIKIDIQFINGVFLTESGDVGIRYDQGISFDFTYQFEFFSSKESA